MRTPQATSNRVLRHLLALMRPYSSPEEGSVIPYLLRQLPEDAPAWIDGAGNLHVDMRTNHRHRTLFVGHTDTVHRLGGPNYFREDAVGIHATGGVPLGADDAAGVSIMTAMIGTVPAYYIFTRGEECGGIGSCHLAEYHKELLREFDRAIAFDRKGTADVITHQMHGQCASDEFAGALADALNSADEELLYTPSDKGIYTDTAEFTGIIPECTNISVGYYGEHTKTEWLDTAHHRALLRAVLLVDWDALPVGTIPEEDEFMAGEWPPALDATDEAIRDAVSDALEGKKGPLLDLIALKLHPEEPSLARRHLSPGALSEAEITMACLDYGDWPCVLEHLADEAFIPY